MEAIDELFCDTYNLEMRSVIAKGGYGIVFRVFSKQYKQEFALKRIPLKNFKANEVNTMMKLNNKHICNLYQYYSFDNYIYMLLEFCPMSLTNAIIQMKNPSLEWLMKNIYEILIGIQACHHLNIAHSDIKPQNILFDKYNRIKICDFGLASEIDCNKSNKIEGSLCFMAPEILKGKTYDPFKADVWSLGVTFYFMATKTYPFSPNQSKESLLHSIVCGLYDDTLIEFPYLRSLISQCLKVDPNDRPTVKELMAHKFFTKLFDSTQATPLRLGTKCSISSIFAITRPVVKFNPICRHKTTPTGLACKEICIPHKTRRTSGYL